MVLGRSAGLTEDQIAHIGDDPLPDDLYDDLESAIVRYARQSTRMDPIDDRLYAALSKGLTTRQVMEVCFTVGAANVINRFHATFLTDVDEDTWTELGGSCPIRVPAQPGLTPPA